MDIEMLEKLMNGMNIMNSRFEEASKERKNMRQES